MNFRFLFLLVLFFKGLAFAQVANEQVIELLKTKLNSERIAYFFGSYGVEVLCCSNERVRISHLYSLHEGKKVTRTLAVTFFEEVVCESLSEVQAEILRGKSIGASLKEKGWSIEKAPLYFGSVDLSEEIQKEMCVEEARGAVEMYKLLAGQEKIHYCTIMEVHSPAYLNEEWLQSLYSHEFSFFREKTPLIENLISTFERIFFSKS